METEITEETEEPENMFQFDIHITNGNYIVDKYSNTTSYDVPINHAFKNHENHIKIYYKGDVVYVDDSYSWTPIKLNKTQEYVNNINYKLKLNDRIHYIKLLNIHFYFEVKEMHKEDGIDTDIIEEGVLKNIKFDVDVPTNIQRYDFQESHPSYIDEDELTQDELATLKNKKDVYKIYNDEYFPNKNYLILIVSGTENKSEYYQYNFSIEAVIPENTRKHELELLDKLCKIMTQNNLMFDGEVYPGGDTKYTIEELGTNIIFDCSCSWDHPPKVYYDFYWGEIENIVESFEKKIKYVSNKPSKIFSQNIATSFAYNFGCRKRAY